MKATAKMFGSHPFRTITFLVVIMMTSLPTVTSRYENCETKSNGVVSYSACAAAARELVGMNFAVSVEPPNLTCGVTGPTSYCTMGLMECGTCNATNPHPPSAITDMNMTSGAVKSTWWQSVSWTMYPTPLQINITANFNKAYELVDDLKISFKSPRPRKMTILKSVDYGKTWTPMQYYSSNCDRLVQRGVATSFTSTNPDAVICTNRYSSEVPYKDADVIFPVRDRYNLFLTPGNSDRSRLYTAFETTNLTDFLQFTGIRIMLEEPNTDGKETLKRPQDLLKYFYAVSAISVTGSCSCNRHGKYCIPDPKGTNKICECMHNTEGNECERCKPLYNNRPWKRGSYLPYPTGTANECQKCECYGHADSCVYDAKLGTGVCQNCTHNTRGKNCEVCITGYRHNSSLPKTDPNACVPCICDPIGVKNNDTNCNDKGQCPCKPNVIGLKCDQCASGHYGLKLPGSNGTCLACNCVLDGTLNYNNTCDPVNGQCQCKPNINGRTCNVCKDGYYSFPSDGSGHTDCLPCNCDPGGSKSLTCEKSTGQCSCQVGLSGRTCNRALPGFYVPTVDAYNLQPLSGNCKRGTAMNHASVVMTDRYYFNCTFGKDIPTVHFQDMNGGEMTNAKLRWQYTPVLRYTLNSSAPWQSARVEIAKVSNSVVNLKRLQEINNNTIAPTCPDTAGVIGVISFSDLKPGKGKAAVAGANVTLDVRCVYSVTLTLPAPGNTSSSIVIDSIAMAPDYTESRIYKNAMNGQKAEYKTCFESTLDLESRTQTLGNNVCSQFNLAVGAETHNGANECSCDPKGSTEIQKCLALGGQCTCKPGVMGRSCDRCAPGFYNFTSAGCTLCRYLPCLTEMKLFVAMPTESKGAKHQRGAAIFIIIMLSVLMTVVILILLHKRTREKVFVKVHDKLGDKNDEASGLVAQNGRPKSQPQSVTPKVSTQVYHNQEFLDDETPIDTELQPQYLDESFTDLERASITGNHNGYGSISGSPIQDNAINDIKNGFQTDPDYIPHAPRRNKESYSEDRPKPAVPPRRKLTKNVPTPESEIDHLDEVEGSLV